MKFSQLGIVLVIQNLQIMPRAECSLEYKPLMKYLFETSIPIVGVAVVSLAYLFTSILRWLSKRYHFSYLLCFHNLCRYLSSVIVLPEDEEKEEILFFKEKVLTFFLVFDKY